MVIQILASLGAGFDCASKSEISKAIDCGANPESIIYANPTKSISHLKFSKEMNVKVMTVDNEFEIHKIHKFYRDARWIFYFDFNKISINHIFRTYSWLNSFSFHSLVLRFRCDAQASFLSLGEKYGCDPQTEAPKLIELSKSLGLNVGFTFCTNFVFVVN